VIGHQRRQFEEDSREWWSRVGGLLLAVALGWVVVAIAAIYAPWAVMNLTGRDRKACGVGWLADHYRGRAHGDEPLDR
jgi:hypothetical protein